MLIILKQIYFMHWYEPNSGQSATESNGNEVVTRRSPKLQKLKPHYQINFSVIFTTFNYLSKSFLSNFCWRNMRNYMSNVLNYDYWILCTFHCVCLFSHWMGWDFSSSITYTLINCMSLHWKIFVTTWACLYKFLYIYSSV